VYTLEITVDDNEKVIKVKADVAALHIFFSDIDAASGGVESCQGPVVGRSS